MSLLFQLCYEPPDLLLNLSIRPNPPSLQILFGLFIDSLLLVIFFCKLGGS